jgi:hypothetical protein
MRSTRIPRGIAYRCAVGAAAIAGLMAFASPAQADFGVSNFQSSLLDGSGVVDNPAQAGAHPFAQQVQFSFNATTHNEYNPAPSPFPGSQGEGPDPDGAVKTTAVDLPPGLLGNPQAVPLCALSDFPGEFFGGPGRCPIKAQIGVAVLDLSTVSGSSHSPLKVPVYNLQPPKGVIARIGFTDIAPIIVDIKLRTGGDYGITATASNISEAPLI